MKKFVSLFLTLSLLLTAFALSASAVSPVRSDIDLAVTGAGMTASNVYDGDRTTVFATLRNLGSTEVNGNYSVTFYIDGRKVQTVTGHQVIPTNTMKNISTTITSKITFGTHKITAQVNPENQLGEENTANNRVKKRVTVSDNVNPNPSDEKYLEPQKTPVQKVNAWRIEAEDCTLVGKTAVTNVNPNYSGKGYVLAQKDEGSGIKFVYDAPVDGNYTISARLGNGTDKSNTLILTVGTKSKANSVYALRDWKCWSNLNYNMNLKKGINTVTLLTNSVVNNEIAIDYVEIRQSISEISSFSFEMENNPGLYCDIPCSISETRISALISSPNVDISKLVATFKTSADSVKVSGVEQKSGVTANNFNNGQYYDCYSATGALLRRYTVTFEYVQNTNLPNVYANITSADPEGDLKILLNGSKSDRNHNVAVNMSVVANEASYLSKGDNNFKEVIEQPATIHIRGNSTSGFKKKSYKVKFDTKQTVLDMDKNKHWVLNANHDDKTMMRQYVGFEIARVLDGMHYSPEWRFVNFYLEGKYMGVYILGQNIRISKDRVNIDEIKTGATDITGGYILELDGREDSDASLIVPTISVLGSRNFTLTEPDEKVVTKEHVDYISGYLTEAFETLRYPTTKEYEKYFDMDSFVDWFVCAEIAKVNDWTGFTSIYIYKEAGVNGKLYAGPVWDFLPGLGACTNAGILEPEGFYMNSMWYSKMKQDPDFMVKVKERYKYFRENFDVLTLIRELEDYLSVAQKDNYDRWGTLIESVWPNRFIYNTYGEYVDEFYDWMDARLKWLDKQWLS